MYAGNPDILICGNCRELFEDIVDLLEHKKIYCKMRFTCKCDNKEEQDKCGEHQNSSPASSSAPSSATSSSSGEQRLFAEFKVFMNQHQQYHR